ncbi:hypothetical protein AMAG_20148 [Allomyces macrogynus ATCC 38327]|uniref:Uncharacterized protein n=1 Tax=Allomyces macrogynus (strain ATCC 38327) TaxID=578462 RepID=A0A0L0T5F6_ALLM3|nr:hypothetical protein AMAG_20148 [Allomyces macrogynus ATCC 38327]|eukprot:KNE69960.1 hypothetical protein AMAG_20148 [Allomyces macrogynus ATCC 38327]
MSCHAYATLLQHAMATAELRTPSPSPMFTCLAQDHAKQLDAAVDASRAAMADVSWTLDLTSRLRTELDRITSVIDLAATQFNRHVAETEWTGLVAAIDDKVNLGTGLAAARVVADYVAAWETAYHARARGPTATPMLMVYIRGQAGWIASVVDLARVQAELADEDVEKMWEMADIVRKSDVVWIAIAVEMLAAVEAQVQAEADALVALLGVSADAQESAFDADAVVNDLSD